MALWEQKKLNLLDESEGRDLGKEIFALKRYVQVFLIWYIMCREYSRKEKGIKYKIMNVKCLLCEYNFLTMEIRFNGQSPVTSLCLIMKGLV